MFNRLFRHPPSRPIAFAWIALLGLLSILLAPRAFAKEEFLEPEAAFKFTARMHDPKTIALTFAIADGYYMYRERFQFKAAGATLGTPELPRGIVKYDTTFEKDVESYRKQVTIMLPVQASAPFALTVTSQGCTDQGLCYAPMESVAKLSPNGGGLLADMMPGVLGQSRDIQSSQFNAAPTAAADTALSGGELSSIEASLKSRKLLVILPLFLLLGLGLAFTPCVLPMVPILSFIIVGEGAKVPRSRAFILSVAYALGMAIVYTALGIAAGLIGEGLAATLQNPWVLGLFALLMAALALSMFGVYQLQVPAAIQSRLLRVSERQSAGKLFGVFAMGAISALIVGPCVAAPLAGALVYISQTRDVVIGGGALFAMAAGMSVPLLLVGLSAGTLLPRAGAWMEAVKRFFGVLMLALALWMVAPVLPAWVAMLGWAALGLGYGVALLRPLAGGFSIAFGVVFALFGLAQLAGVASGGRNAWAPLSHLTGNVEQPVQFARVRSVGELDAMLASAQGKTVMLDFYADWCVSCKEMEKLTFTDPGVRRQMSRLLLLQVDVTANNADDKAMLKRFNLFGPPGIIFFGPQATELPGTRVIGYQNAARFTRSLSLALEK
ncbi:protein-disulfide reductase DsbD [Herminiimonas sp. CN]|uniref:protein-disulfide reductase DsbD n=1 Tax=Herminiimonas sp. CN TaxID=1349818 RepID=UPI000554839A|nr:protein-disulfide reductase DsbD [Herminiimonas sp. CN]